MDQVSVPIINSDTPLKTGIVRQEDIQGYLILDQEIFTGNTGQIQNLVAVKHVPSFPFPLIVVDLENRELIESKVCLIESEGIRINKVYDTGKGLIVSPK